MRINDLPRPWLLAAMTGVSISALLEQAERERAKRPEEEGGGAVRIQFLRSRSVCHRDSEPVEMIRLAS